MTSFVIRNGIGGIGCVQATKGNARSKPKSSARLNRAAHDCAPEISAGLGKRFTRINPPKNWLRGLVTDQSERRNTSYPANVSQARAPSPRLWLRLLMVTGFVALATAAHAESGIASIYGNGDGYAWRKTASGEVMDPRKLTAAHKTLKFGTLVTVTNTKNGKSVVVKVNDRGPFIAGRIVDLTPAGAKALGFDGLAPVTVNPRP